MNRFSGFILLLLLNISSVFAQDASIWRPVFHFTPPQNWINDPNGMVWHKGKYHLFYQYNPFGNQWGHMTWAHATSKNLLTWEHLPIAIPEEDSTMIFSGSTVVDTRNSSGFGAGAMVAVYTGHQPHNQSQHLAFSNDDGHTWKKHNRNPVLDLQKKDFRDPNVFWHEPLQQWVMAVVLPNEYKVQFYSSKNLKNWTLLSEFGNAGDRRKIWECPSLVELPVEGTTQTKWVLFVSCSHPQEGFVGMQYFVGSFDGKTFQNDNPDNQTLWVDYGKDFYAAIPWNQAPQNRKLWLGWMNNWAYANDLPTPTWKGQMSVPRELALRRTPVGLRLTQKPVKEVYSVLNKVAALQFIDLKNEEITLDSTATGKANVYEISVEFKVQEAKDFGIKIAQNANGQATIIGYDAVNQQLYIDRTKSGKRVADNFLSRDTAPLKEENGKISLQILLDKCTVEVFANGGSTVLSSLIFPDANSTQVSLFANSGRVKVNSIQVRK